MLGVIYINDSEWVYKNDGTADLLTISGTTLTNLPESQSKTGTAFYQTQRVKCFDLPATSEIWIKFDVYTTLSYRWRAYNDSTSGATGICSQTSGEFNIWVNSSQIKYFSSTVKNQLQTYFLHMKSGSSDGIVEAWLDGKKLYTYTGNVNNGDSFEDIYLQSDGSGTYFSNVVISNKPNSMYGKTFIAPQTYAAIIDKNGRLVIAPQTYATLILSNGKIIIQPKIYATIVAPEQKPDIITADTCRKITNKATAIADTARNIQKTQTATADTLRNVQLFQNIIADTIRIVNSKQNITADTLRNINHNQAILADTLRTVNQNQTISADTLRIVKQSQDILADALRVIVSNQNVVADTDRIVGRSQNILADTIRVVGTSQAISADSLRIINVTQNILADTLRLIRGKLDYFADTMRIVKQSNVISGDTERIVGHYQEVLADTARIVKGIQVITADTLRQLKSDNNIIADTLRNINVSQDISVDTLRIITQSSNIIADTIRIINKNERIIADTLRVIESRREIAVADTHRNVGCSQEVFADTLVVINNSESIIADTLIQAAKAETVKADTLIKNYILNDTSADTWRIVNRQIVTTADTLIRVPHELVYYVSAIPKLKAKRLMAANSSNSLVSTFADYGITNFSVTLSERTLSDIFSIETARAMEINDAVKGQLLDYPFSFLVEETSQRDLIQSVRGMYDVDRLLYTQIYLSDGSSEIDIGADESGLNLIKASGYISQIAHYLGLTANIKMQDFVPYHDFFNSNITYSDLLNTVFGWTSRLPQRQVNIFIRGGVLNCIQRGMEDSVFDITDLPHSRPTIHKKLIRSLWNNPFNDIDEDKDDPTENYTEIEISKPFSGTISFSNQYVNTVLTYKSGYLMNESTTMSARGFKSSTEKRYSYENFSAGSKLSSDRKFNFVYEGDYFLTRARSITNTITDGKAEGSASAVFYEYKKTQSGDYYLGVEIDIQASGDSGTITLGEDSFDADGVESQVRMTIHTPLGNGWYAHHVYADGRPQGSTISQGKPGNSVTPYTINEVQKTFSNAKINLDDSDDNDKKKLDYNDWRRKLAPIMDTSFPVREFDILIELTEAIYWLNRKVQEEVTVEIIDNIVGGVPSINHIVDFTERVKFNGNEYFLVSNNIRFTPRRMIQRLQLVRWY